MSSLIKLFLQNESGSTAIEYGLIAGFLSVLIIGGVTGVGSRLSGKYASVASTLP
jgi:pilus assembly protein Flp/PilA